MPLGTAWKCDLCGATVVAFHGVKFTTENPRWRVYYPVEDPFRDPNGGKGPYSCDAFVICHAHARKEE